MQIKTKYEPGQKTWVVYENHGEVCIYDDIITEICISSEGMYYMLETACNEINEEDVILYDDKERLLAEIEKLMQEIHDKEREVI